MSKMRFIIKCLVSIAASTIISCNQQKPIAFKSKEVYKSGDLVIIQIAKNSFEHVSFLQTHDFGNAPCNGLIVRSKNEAIIFDTPTNDKSATKLIEWTNKVLGCKINAIIPTHFHEDCLGGLQAFNDRNIPSYAYFKTIELAKANHLAIPKNSFNDSLILRIGNEEVYAKFWGKGHTKDNIIGYFPSDKILFGGCLVKELGANKGYLGDADTISWSGTVEKIKIGYPNSNIIIPGHGKYGDRKLLDYTIDLFK